MYVALDSLLRPVTDAAFPLMLTSTSSMVQSPTFIWPDFSASKIAARKIRPIHARVREVRVSEIRALQIGAAKVGSFQLATHEGCAVKIAPAKAGVLRFGDNVDRRTSVVF